MAALALWPQLHNCERAPRIWSAPAHVHAPRWLPYPQGIQKCRRKPQSSVAYLYNGLAVMAAELGRVEEARAWFEEGTRTLEGAQSVALWQVREGWSLAEWG